MANVNVALSRVLFAGDSNLKFVERFVGYLDKKKVKVLTVRGASIVDDKTGFCGSLYRFIDVYKPDTICLHLGSNDADNGKTSTFYRELNDLLDGIRSRSRNCKVILCSVLPRSQNNFKGKLWNSNILPRIQADVQTVNDVLKQTCLERDLQWLVYNLPEQHLGWDGLHVRPPGAEYLLSAVLAKLQGNNGSPKSIPTSNFIFKEEQWPLLPKTKLDTAWKAAIATQQKRPKESKAVNEINSTSTPTEKTDASLKQLKYLKHYKSHIMRKSVILIRVYRTRRTLKLDGYRLEIL